MNRLSYLRINNSGNFATSAAIRRALSFVSSEVI
jgi:hypothetical protein